MKKDERNELLARVEQWAGASEDHISITILGDMKKNKVSACVSGDDTDLANILFTTMQRSTMLKYAVLNVAKAFTKNEARGYEYPDRSKDC